MMPIQSAKSPLPFEFETIARVEKRGHGGPSQAQLVNMRMTEIDYLKVIFLKTQ